MELLAPKECQGLRGQQALLENVLVQYPLLIFNPFL
jgi:hypothetical protein